MEELVIEREKWLRGKPPENAGNYLWIKKFEAGCCLGHVCNKIRGLTLDEIENTATPLGLKRNINKLTHTASYTDITHTAFAAMAMEINDRGNITDIEREEQLIELFAKNGIKLKFTGQGKPK